MLQKIRDIHAVHYGYESSVNDDEIMSFIQEEYARPGAEENLTVGEVIRNFIGALNILQQNPNYERAKLFGKLNNEEKVPEPNINSRFSRTEG
ncbi:BREX system ATP-binding domain-containing protein [Alkalihalobacillus deserti]|uniref:BREX system ATP-binding domain-containing protein n=1 Tax=Alkalihalobacillus deserti TaxID=2879466 RepID=UPI00223D64A4|nr:BREX system ATP-binding domain-containing protein [Alkalihalobacillus deserti]